ncbi:MAG: hypothetical protein DLM67_24090 [Candidatus Nephthysia bennettiae]|nr:MAG: hypothetical protein DLM67_24090 [Candidatus Dormibacteraeota bacterium]
MEPTIPEQRRRQVSAEVRAALDEILRMQRPGQPFPPPPKLHVRRNGPERGSRRPRQEGGA